MQNTQEMVEGGASYRIEGKKRISNFFLSRVPRNDNIGGGGFDSCPRSTPPFDPSRKRDWGKGKKKKFPIFIQLLYLCARLSDSLDIEEEERREDKEIWENDTTVYECVCDR